MESLYLLIPLSVVFIVGAVALFFWAVNSGQYDDLESEGERILFDEEKPDQPAPPVDQASKDQTATQPQDDQQNQDV